jgi:hypothetical protein
MAKESILAAEKKREIPIKKSSLPEDAAERL